MEDQVGGQQITELWLRRDDTGRTSETSKTFLVTRTGYEAREGLGTQRNIVGSSGRICRNPAHRSTVQPQVTSGPTGETKW
jgi:hypothetical protein